MAQHDIRQLVQEHGGLARFNPLQEAVLTKDLFNSNLVVSAPTASGKTVLAELAALDCILNKKRKVVYTCPLRALASEQYNNFKEKYSKPLNIRATISTGDFDSTSSYLKNYDIIFSTMEKLDSLCRHNAEWLQSIGLLIVDEIHELGSDRGPTLEMVITKLRFMNPQLRILALSATIPNAPELAQWLNADLVESTYRPTRLREGAYFDKKIHFNDGVDEIAVKGQPVSALVRDTLQREKQALLFATTRKRAEAAAERLAADIEKTLSPREKTRLAKAAQQALNALESPTEQCRKISGLIARGTAFHHAGLLNKQRSLIEDLFRERLLKTVSATPTLFAGVNLPAFRVIIPSVYRFSGYGSERIPVREWKQIVGRAGRPQFDDHGEAVAIAKTESERDELLEYYVNGEVEDVSSKLGIEPVLRTHLLAAIAGNFVRDLDSMEKFFSKTFYAHQFGRLDELFVSINDSLSELRDWGFVDGDQQRFRATPLGRRVAELYLDPLTGHKFVQGLQRLKHDDPFYLYLWSDSYELAPWLSPPKNVEAEVWEEIQSNATALPVDVQQQMFYDNQMLSKYFTSKMLNAYIDEVPEQTLLTDYNVAPGVLYAKTRTIDWLAYSCSELAKLLGLKEHLPHLNILRKRVQHGVRKELVFLTEVRHIGRVRARRLWNNNVRSVADLKKISIASLARIIPPAIAEKVKEQLGVPTKLSVAEKRGLTRSAGGGQSTLEDHGLP